jgi:nicotinamidase-related amidase
MNYTAPDFKTSALLTIDVQRDFTDPGAPAEIAGTAERLPAMRRVLEFYRQKGLPVVHVVRLYLRDGTNVDVCRREVIENGKEIVIPDSTGADLVEPLKRTPDLRLDAELLLSGRLQQMGKNEWAIYKPRWDAFYGTSLEEHLRGLGISTVVVVGCNYPNCPRSTVYGASMRDFRTVLLADAVSGVYEQGLRELNNIGVPTPSSYEWLAECESARTVGSPA